MLRNRPDSLLSWSGNEGVRVSVAKLYEILKEKYVIRSKWKENFTESRGPVPKVLRLDSAARWKIQMDTVMFGRLFAFTGIGADCTPGKRTSCWPPRRKTATYGCAFLEQAAG